MTAERASMIMATFQNFSLIKVKATGSWVRIKFPTRAIIVEIVFRGELLCGRRCLTRSSSIALYEIQLTRLGLLFEKSDAEVECYKEISINYNSFTNNAVVTQSFVVRFVRS